MSVNKILILDDQPEITEIVEHFVLDRYSDIETKTTNKPKEALELIHQEKYTLIITDHHMPEVSGIQFLEEIRKNEGLNKETPVVFLTAMQAEVEAEIGGKYNDVIFINKVDNIQSIIDVIEKYLN